MEAKLRLCWIPQLPGPSFYVEVKTLEEANLLLETLAYYDDFQFTNRIKPDYSNIGSLQEYDEELGWTDWYDEKSGDSFDEYRKQHLSKYAYNRKDLVSLNN